VEAGLHHERGGLISAMAHRNSGRCIYWIYDAFRKFVLRLRQPHPTPTFNNPQAASAMLTRVFKSGNSLAVRIPKELAFLEPAQNVQIERVGNTLVLRPAEPETLADLADIFAAFSADFMSQGREPHEQKERDWGLPSPSAGEG
jgi:antitoxin VapB